MNRLSIQLSGALTLAQANVLAACRQKEQAIIESLSTVNKETDPMKHLEDLSQTLIKQAGPVAMTALRLQGEVVKMLKVLIEKASTESSVIFTVPSRRGEDYPNEADVDTDETKLTGLSALMLAVLQQAGCSVTWPPHTFGVYRTMLIKAF